MNFGNDGFGDERRANVLRSLIEHALSFPSVRPALDRMGAMAFHEAGHAIVDHQHGLEVSRASCDPAEGRAYTSATGTAVEAILVEPTTNAIRPFICGALAGIIAESMACREPAWHLAYSDLVFADQFAAMACASDDAVDALLRECATRVGLILRTKWGSASALAEVLRAQGEVHGVQLAALLRL
jgi:hypothetical protein